MKNFTKKQISLTYHNNSELTTVINEVIIYERTPYIRYYIHYMDIIIKYDLHRRKNTVIG